MASIPVLHETLFAELISIFTIITSVSVHLQVTIILVYSTDKAQSPFTVWEQRGVTLYPLLALTFGVEPQHCSSKPSTIQLILIALAHDSPPCRSPGAPFRARPVVYPSGAAERCSQGRRSQCWLGDSLAPLTQRPRSPPGGPRPTLIKSPRGVEPRLLLQENRNRRGLPYCSGGLVGPLSPGLECGVPSQKGRALRWVILFPPPGLPAGRRAPESGYFVLKDRFCRR